MRRVGVVLLWALAIVMSVVVLVVVTNLKHS